MNSPLQVDRDDWINQVCSDFVHPSQSNRQYYRIILETLWPLGHDIPGPVIHMRQIRSAIDSYRMQKDPKAETYKDPARRIREMQGEEGIIGLIKTGNGSATKYQLVHLDLGPKRDPRTGLPYGVWEKILDSYNHCCANCGRHESEMRLDQDHKIPRLRSGGDDELNWQPLCKECNNFKSVACRGCDLDCLSCPWAFPEKFAPVRLNTGNIELIRNLATDRDIAPSELLNTIVEEYLQQNLLG